MNTRNISIWRGAAGVVFAVNPKELSFTHTRKFKERELLSGETVVTPAAMLPTEIAFETFFPGGESPFFKGDEPGVLVERIGAWQAAHEAVSLFIDGERCGNFYVKSFRRTVKEGDGDVYVALSLIEAPKSAVAESVSRPRRSRSRNRCEPRSTRRRRPRRRGPAR